MITGARGKTEETRTFCAIVLLIIGVMRNAIGAQRDKLRFYGGAGRLTTTKTTVALSCLLCN